ncbi:hypothetical protein U1Q18_013442 [Sarracenia purpurea var. burkii]
MKGELEFLELGAISVSSSVLEHWRPRDLRSEVCGAAALGYRSVLLLADMRGRRGQAIGKHKATSGSSLRVWKLSLHSGTRLWPTLVFSALFGFALFGFGFCGLLRSWWFVGAGRCRA